MIYLFLPSAGTWLSFENEAELRQYCTVFNISVQVLSSPTVFFGTAK